MSYIGDFALGTTFDTKFTTVNTTGVPTTLAGSPVISAYPDNSTTELTAGITLSVDFDGRTGLHNVRVIATSGNGYASGSNYQLVITVGTVGGNSVVGYVVCEFSIDARVARANLIQVDGVANSSHASGKAPADVLTIAGTTQTARDIGASVLLSAGAGAGQLDFTSGVVKANQVQVDGSVNATHATGMNPADARDILGTAISTPATAGILDVNVKNMNNVAATPITTIKAVQGLATDGVVPTVTTVTNRVTANTDQWAGGTIPAPVVTGVPKIDLTYILGTLLTETAGQIAAAFKQFFDVASPTGTMKAITNVVTTTNVTNRVTANTDQWNGQAVATPNSNGVPIVDTRQLIRQGTAQGTGNSTTAIKLDASASATNGFYKGMLIAVISGTGAPEIGVCTAYDGTTKIATITPAWPTAPDGTSVFQIFPAMVDLEAIVEGAVPAPAVTGIPKVDLTDIDGQATNGNNATLNLKKLSINSDSGPGLSIVGGNDSAISIYSGNDNGNGIVGITGVGIGLYISSTADAIYSESISGGKSINAPQDIAVSDGSLTLAAISSAVWVNATRTLTSFGTLISDIWSAVTRTITGGAIDTNNDKAGYALTTTEEDAIVDKVWDEATSGHQGAGTTGKALTDAGAAGDPWGTTLPGAYGAGTAGNIVGNNLDAKVSDVKAKTDNLPADPADESLLEAAIAAVQADTDNLQTRLPAALTGAGNIKADAQVVSDKSNYALTSAYDAAKTASQAGDAMTLTVGERGAVADKMLGRNLAGGSDGGRTVQQALRMLRNLRQIVSGVLTVMREDDATPDWTASVTQTPGDPVSKIDPG